MTLADLDFSKTYSYADYLKWTFDDRVELIDGIVFPMGPSPGTLHHIVSNPIFISLYKHLEDKDFSVFRAPFDVRLPRKSPEDKEIFTVLQPDICVICDQSKLDAKGCLGAPDIVIEILSPGNNKNELDNKFQAYQEALVKEYWIIHPDEQTFLKYVLNENHEFVADRLLTSGSFVTTPILPDFKLDLEEVFKEASL